MENLLVFAVFFIGLVIIVKGGDMFVDSAIWIAEKTGIPSMIIGATIVSIATTLPELFVSTVASNQGHSDMAIGNAIGSSICNIAFIIGLCAFIKPIKINRASFSLKGFIMIVCVVVFYVFAFDGVVDFGEGIFLMVIFSIFIMMNIIELKSQNKNIQKNKKSISYNKKEIFVNIIKFVLGALFIVIGAHILVDTGIKISQMLRIPKQVVSLTLLAVGTSLPELVTAIVALIKGESNISVGNIIGANILNLTSVIGASTLVSDHGLLVNRQTLFLDTPFSFLIMILFVLSGFLKGEINRKTGALLLILYIIYLLILF
ncbi:calcium/sodium antiporter [Anaerosalibacter sp. Marseille-P3206]|uniref:calcium/sodium antiporter n=1 Tax=Anaerosalibacter sp. Marseille-P3206 TaxID=1871005 RepID=UPI000986ECB6|nr:calcium/sodium antiporter [Anaerosalibacter sp. Marseille-P3206]